MVLETQFVENDSVNQGLSDDVPLKVRYFKTFPLNPQMAVPCIAKNVQVTPENGKERLYSLMLNLTISNLPVEKYTHCPF